MRELIEECEDQDDMVLPLFLGKDVSGKPVVSDLAAMPHLLIAGSTGSGKSVCINSLIASILLKRTPDEVRLVLIDPKMVELSGFEDIPHLLSPVVTDMKKAPSVLEWAVKKMDQRYDLLASVGVRHIKQFNELGEDRIKSRLLNRGALLEDIPYHLPYIVVVVDEYADLMMVASKDVEKSITRLAQKSRAVGIHVILATQRPSVDVITGLIKSNMTTRIGFRVSSKVDSRTILDRNGETGRHG
jgi:S-DNA-T family DNA segregation ATPase FtsK/SpoIIIE